MRCPCCEKELIVTHQDYYNSSTDFDDRDRHCLMDGYQCTDPRCEANQLGCVWLDDGEFLAIPPEGIESYAVLRIIKSRSKAGNAYALDSWRYEYDKKEEAERKGSIKIPLHFLPFIAKRKLVIVPNYSRNDDGKWRHGFLDYKIEWWKQDSVELDTWVKEISTFRMTRYVISEFNRLSHLALEGDKSAINDCLNYADGKNVWGEKDDRLYARIASNIISVFYMHRLIKILSKAHK